MRNLAPVLRQKLQPKKPKNIRLRIESLLTGNPISRSKTILPTKVIKRLVARTRHYVVANRVSIIARVKSQGVNDQAALNTLAGLAAELEAEFRQLTPMALGELLDELPNAITTEDLMRLTALGYPKEPALQLGARLHFDLQILKRASAKLVSTVPSARPGNPGLGDDVLYEVVSDLKKIWEETTQLKATVSRRPDPKKSYAQISGGIFVEFTQAALKNVLSKKYIELLPSKVSEVLYQPKPQKGGIE